MNLHEYQAKEIFTDYSLPIAQGEVASSVEQALQAADNLGGNAWMVKAQIHAGGRGKAGGVKYCRTKEEVAMHTKRLLHSHLVTLQTTSQGQPVNQVLIATPCDIVKEFYLGAVIDRSLRRVVIMASTEGGVDIETVAADTPQKIFKLAIEPLFGLLPHQCRDVAFRLGLKGSQIKQFSVILMALSKMFVEKDLNLVEINPLIMMPNGQLLCLDAKVVIDDNALYRQGAIRAKRDPSQEDKRENHARDWELNYIALEGDIACMVNGAGLAMATMDMIQLCGGIPANFLDVGGSATKERVTQAFKIILSDPNVKGILVNIFGGIVRCDMIAEGIIAAVKKAAVTIPVVVRLEGNHAKAGSQKLNDSNMRIIAAQNLQDAAEKIVNEVKST